MQITKRRIREIVLEEMSSFLDGGVPHHDLNQAIIMITEQVKTADDAGVLSELETRLSTLFDLIDEKRDGFGGEDEQVR